MRRDLCLREKPGGAHCEPRETCAVKGGHPEQPSEGGSEKEEDLAATAKNVGGSGRGPLRLKGGCPLPSAYVRILCVLPT